MRTFLAQGIACAQAPPWEGDREGIVDGVQRQGEMEMQNGASGVGRGVVRRVSCRPCLGLWSLF